jgi:hypothetical protein
MAGFLAFSKTVYFRLVTSDSGRVQWLASGGGMDYVQVKPVGVAKPGLPFRPEPGSAV